jgi:hypothetical protein
MMGFRSTAEFASEDYWSLDSVSVTLRVKRGTCGVEFQRFVRMGWRIRRYDIERQVAETGNGVEVGRTNEGGMEP